jgi:NDP-sugar pyrophosphorylase family protein
VLASGSGRRQRVLTNPKFNRYARPKAMLPVGNMVLIDFSIEALKGLGLLKLYVGAGPRPLSDILERRLLKRELYNAEIQMHSEQELLDTAGTVNYLIQNFIQPYPNDTICVLPCDTPHNINLGPILESHLRTGAAATVAALPIRWSSPEWAERTFGTIRLKGMPNIEKYPDRNVFEAAVKKFTRTLGGETFRVKGFDEKVPRDEAPSNLINTGIYFFNAGFLMDLDPIITRRYPEDSPTRFSDFGLHLFPLLGGRHEEFAYIRNKEPKFFNKIAQGEYQFNAYVLPPNTYWRDVGNPIALIRANMSVLDGKLDTGLEYRLQRWEPQSWGWKGAHGTTISDQAVIASPKHAGTLGSIISGHVTVGAGAMIERSVVLNYSEVHGRVINSLCFPGTTHQVLESTAHIRRNIIGNGIELANSIFVGGDLRLGQLPAGIRDRIIYENVTGGISFDPL